MTHAETYAAELRAEATRLRELARRLDRRARNDPVRAREARVATARANSYRRREATREAFRGAFRRMGPGWHASPSLAAEAGVRGSGTRVATLRDLCELGEVVHNGRGTRMSRFRWAAYPEPPPEPAQVLDREPARAAVDAVAELVGRGGWHTCAEVAAAVGLAPNTTGRALRGLLMEGVVVSNGHLRRGRRYAARGAEPEPPPEPPRARSGPAARAAAPGPRVQRLPATQPEPIEARVRAALAGGEVGLTDLRREVQAEPEALAACLQRLVATRVAVVRRNPDCSVGADRVLVQLRPAP